MWTGRRKSSGLWSHGCTTWPERNRTSADRARQDATTAEWRPTALRRDTPRADTGAPSPVWEPTLVRAGWQSPARPERSWAAGADPVVPGCTSDPFVGRPATGVGSGWCVADPGDTRPGAANAAWKPSLMRRGAGAASGGRRGCCFGEDAAAPSGRNRSQCAAASAERASAQLRGEVTGEKGAAPEQQRRARGGRSQRCGALAVRGGRRRKRPTRPVPEQSGGIEEQQGTASELRAGALPFPPGRSSIAQRSAAVAGGAARSSLAGSGPSTAETRGVSRGEDVKEEVARRSEGARGTGATGDNDGRRGRGWRGV